MRLTIELGLLTCVWPESLDDVEEVAARSPTGDNSFIDNIIASLTASVDPVSLMRRIAEQVCVFSPKANGAGVSICTPDGHLVFVSAHGISAPLLGHSMPIEGTFHEMALQSKEPQTTDDATHDQQISPRTRELAATLGIRSWVVIPLYHLDSAIGALSVVAEDPGVFGPLDVASVASLSSFISALISSQSEISEILDDILRDHDGPGQPLTARFLASVLLPGGDLHSGLYERLNSILARDDGLVAVFQPIVELETRETRELEGLCRFPAVGEMSPGQWFGAARRIGLGAALELKALRTVLRDVEKLPKHLTIAVNLSPMVALDPVAQDMLLSAERRIILELTEHEPFPDNLSAGLQELRDFGVVIAVDDAGAGFASFTQLLRLRPDMIKIDGELTANIEHDPVKRAFVSAIVVLSGELGASTVAEAVETAEQLDVLASLGIEKGQGYFLGHPSPAARYIGCAPTAEQ